MNHKNYLTGKEPSSGFNGALNGLNSLQNSRNSSGASLLAQVKFCY